MAYQALYRKWRPLTFDDVVGQEHITQTLKNEIVNGKLAHANLFCGTRGTGKTSTAKILARAVNCLNPQNGNPCNECEVCRGILDETIMDVLELDGASRNKVENIRDIIDDVMFLPSVAKKKVYIIDEVHMVTTQAFNALLKTLEEPPEHVMFILATTELNKIPPTVLSRCQRFDFRRITNEDIVGRLKTILAGDGRSATDAALSLVAELGDGSMRDSLSILDQCLGFGEETLTYDDVVSIIGIADNDALYRICEAVSENDSETALRIVDDILLGGKELSVFMERLIKFLRDLLIVKLTKEPGKILVTSQENLMKMKALSEKITKEKLLNSLKLLNDSVIQAKFSSFARTVYELAVVKMCDPSTDDSYDALLDRVAQMEKRLAEGVFTVSVAKNEAPSEASDGAAPPWEEPERPVPQEIAADGPAAGTTQPPEPAVTEVPEPQQGEGKFAAVSKWPEVLSYIKMNGGMPMYSHLNKAKVREVGGRLGLVFGAEAMISKSVVSKPSNLELVAAGVKAVTGETVTVACFSAKEIGESEQEEDPLKKLEELSKKHSIIEII